MKKPTKNIKFYLLKVKSTGKIYAVFVMIHTW